MKKALVTGLSGFLGKAIIPYLAGHYKITMLSRSVLAKKSKVAADYIQVDLVKEGISESTSKEWDVVIHAAGKAHSLPQTDEERKAFFDVNLKGTRNLVESLENNLPRSFVFISTIAVYGLVNGEAITEDTPLKARDPYGLSKLKAERFLLDWADRKGVNLTILRLPLLAGPEAPGNLGVMIKGINLGRYVRIGQGQARKSVLWAEDIANIIPHLENISGTYNLTDGHNPTFKELEEAIAIRLGKKIKVIPKPVAKLIAYAGTVINTVLRKRVFSLDTKAYYKITSTLVMDDSKARKELGWKSRRVVDLI